jgi:hypothetical protein
MSEEYRRLREHYRREQAAARAVVGNYRQRPQSRGLTREEAEMVDASMRRFEAEEAARREAAAHSVRGRLRGFWETITK